LNSLLQSAGAIVMKQALIILDQKIRVNKWDAKFIANVHDEWQLEVKAGQEHLVGQAAKESIKQAGEHFKMRCPLDGEYKTGNNWAECH
jgi:DNA polymerase I-like protein with 3'-5' exonuclease and polymerase domains